MIPEIPFRNEHATDEFVSVAAATMVGAYVGHKLDQTKAGRWVNESPTANAFFAVLKTVSIAVAVGLIVIFLICLATV